MATALVVQTILLQFPQYAASMDELTRKDLRKKWFPKLAQQRLLTSRQKRNYKKLQQDVHHAQLISERKATGADLDAQQQVFLERLPDLVTQLAEWDASLAQQAQEAAAPYIEHPPEPLSDLRRADPHRITYVGKNTKKRHAEHWKDMAAVSRPDTTQFTAVSGFRTSTTDAIL